MLDEGLAAMAVGLGTVFGFLIVLMIAVFAMGKIVSYLNKLFPEEIKAVTTAVKKVCNDADVAVAIAIAKLRS